jgi:hypothetical protein
MKNALLWNFTSAGPEFDLIATDTLLNLKQEVEDTFSSVFKSIAGKIPQSGVMSRIKS